VTEEERKELISVNSVAVWRKAYSIPNASVTCKFRSICSVMNNNSTQLPTLDGTGYGVKA